MSSSGGTGAGSGGRPWVQKEVPTLVKDRDLVETRRLQIIQAAVGLFIEKGFHQTTIRQIAAQAGLSIGSLYEYVRSKEDILYLVCDYIHAEMERRMTASISRAADGREALIQAVAAYFTVCDALSDDILLVYQETKSLAPDARAQVLANDARLTGLFEEILNRGVADSSLSVEGQALGLMAHNIIVLGHMWTFRRWYLAKNYTLEDYTRLQTQLLLSELGQGGEAKK